MPAPANPYIIEPPIGGDSGFFGREEIIADVERVLRYPPHTSVILYGQRRSGKTSLLLQLEYRLPDPPFPGIRRADEMDHDDERNTGARRIGEK